MEEDFISEGAATQEHFVLPIKNVDRPFALQNVRVGQSARGQL